MGSQCDEGYGAMYQPLTTKAGSRLWSISFAEPRSEGSGDPPLSMLRAAYPLQLLVRFDRGRQLLVYEAFEFKPLLACQVKADLDTNEVPVTADELRAIDSLVKRTGRQRESMGSFLGGMTAAAGMASMPSPPTDLPHLERCQAYGADALAPLAGWVRFRQSVVRRVRVPVSSIKGARSSSSKGTSCGHMRTCRQQKATSRSTRSASQAVTLTRTVRKPASLRVPSWVVAPIPAL